MTGCSAEPARFSLNLVYLHTQDRESTKRGEEDKIEIVDPILSRDAQRNIATVLDALYGTPDAPRLPPLPEPGALDFLELSKLQRAAGPTGRDDPQGGERGLYRKHCIHCHGVNGDGAGPTAEYLNPYPRDYRRGLFKFKSTASTEPPTHEDLKRVLVEGVPGTAMPSFKVLDDGEIEALVHYVKYLALRGLTERALIELALDELDEGDLYLDTQTPDPARMNELLTAVLDIAGEWQAARATEVPPPPANWENADSVARGRKLFMTKGLCHTCHGVSGLGDQNQDLMDDWTKDFMAKANNGVGIEVYTRLLTADWQTHPDNAESRALLEEFYDRGALPVRRLKPRNLRRGVYRGGRRPVDLFRRVRNGILTMPAAKKPPNADAPNGLVDDDVWHVVAYVRSLPFETITEPNEEIRFQRDLP